MTGVVTTLVVASALAVVSAEEARTSLLHEGELWGVMLAHSVNRQIHERFTRPILARGETVDLDRPEQFAALDQVVRLSIADFGVRTVYVFDLEGRITYSTNPGKRGEVVQDNAYFQKARGGVAASKLVDSGKPLDAGGASGGVPLLETYVPVERLDERGQGTGDLSGVIEVYQDASELQGDVRIAGARVATVSIIGVVALMLALWLWIRKAERTIDERTDELVAANERLAALSEDLEREVKDRSRRLLRAETLATVGTLSAGVAHEVNNPIAAIASCAEGLLRRSNASESLEAHPDFADFPEYLEIIRSEAFRVKTITRNLLDFSRSRTATRVEAVDLGRLLGAAKQLLDHRVAAEGKRLEIDVPAEPVVIAGDGASLRQLVLNLTVNALDAAESLVRWSLTSSEGGAELVCEDDGTGFSEDALERALQPFYTSKPTGEGTGLGLSIAYGIAREHGGSIELSVRPEGGARVVVELSAYAERSSQVAARGAS